MGSERSLYQPSVKVTSLKILDSYFYRPQEKVIVSQASLILSKIGLMATRSLLILVTVRSVRIPLKCCLVSNRNISSIQCQLKQAQLQFVKSIWRFHGVFRKFDKDIERRRFAVGIFAPPTKKFYIRH